jgi:HTH-type transcriptional regulator/antitoxin HigA
VDIHPIKTEADYEAALAEIERLFEAITHHMESRGLSRRDLEPYLGSRARVAEVLNRKRALSLDMIRRLHTGLGIAAEILIQPYALATRAPNHRMQPTRNKPRAADA